MLYYFSYENIHCKLFISALAPLIFELDTRMLASTSFKYHYYKYISYRDVTLYFSASHNSAGIALGQPAITCLKLTIETLD